MTPGCYIGTITVIEASGELKCARKKSYRTVVSCMGASKMERGVLVGLFNVSSVREYGYNDWGWLI